MDGSSETVRKSSGESKGVKCNFLVKVTARTLFYLYKGCIAPFVVGSCRFHPSCSEYCLTCVELYGIKRGVVLGVRRLLKCRPGVSGGVDYP